MIAASLVIGAHLATQHLGADTAGLQTSTPGLYLRLPTGATFGAYRNSYGRGSVYAGWTWSTADGRFALTAGGVTGYSGRPVAPLLAPSVSFDLAAGVAVRVAFLPRVPSVNRAHALHLTLERAF